MQVRLAAQKARSAERSGAMRNVFRRKSEPTHPESLDYRSNACTWRSICALRRAGLTWQRLLSTLSSCPLHGKYCFMAVTFAVKVCLSRLSVPVCLTPSHIAPT